MKEAHILEHGIYEKIKENKAIITCTNCNCKFYFLLKDFLIEGKYPPSKKKEILISCPECGFIDSLKFSKFYEVTRENGNTLIPGWLEKSE